MTVIAETLPTSRLARWTGRVLSGLVIVFLQFRPNGIVSFRSRGLTT